MSFGTRLRELRKSAGLTQRELADRVGVSFTYLSKIENAQALPPSEPVIVALANELVGAAGCPHRELADQLLVLGGKVPTDIAETLAKHPEMLRQLRLLDRRTRRPQDHEADSGYSQADDTGDSVKSVDRQR